MSFNGAIGAELVTNGDFSNGTTGWNFQGTGASVSNGQGVVTCITAGDSILQQYLNLIIGRTYRITLNMGGVLPRWSGPILGWQASNDLIFVATGTTIFFSSLGTGTATFDNISIREVLGYHATQPTGANKPVLSRFSNNLLRWTESFASDVWGKNDLNITTGAIDPDGGSTASIFTATGIDSFIFQGVVVTTGDNTLRFYIKGVGTAIGKQFGFLQWFIGTATGTTAWHYFTLTDDWQEITVTFSATSGGTMAVRFDTPEDSSIGDVVHFWHPQLNIGSTALPYEPVDLYPRQGNFGILTNGSNNFMTITPPPITTECTIVWAGRVNNTSAVLLDGANGVYFAFTGQGKIALYSRIDDSLIALSPIDTVTVSQDVVISVVISPDGGVIRKNGDVVTTWSESHAFASTGAYTLFTNIGFTNFLNALTADLFISNQALPDADLIQIERHAGSIAGVTI